MAGKLRRHIWISFHSGIFNCQQKSQINKNIIDNKL